MSLRLAVHLGDQRTGGVEIHQLPPLGILGHRFRHAMGRENDRILAWNFVQFLDEDGAFLFQRLHHMPVVDNLVAHIDRGAIAFQGALDDLNGAVDTGTESSRGSQIDIQLGFAHPEGPGTS